MNLGEIYDRVVWYYYGDTTPPTTVATHFQGVTEGIIANIHRKLQEDYNYWFMEESYGVAVSAYTREVSLPSDFKHEISPIRYFRFKNDDYTTGTASCSGTTAVTGSGTAWDTSWSGRKYQITWDDTTYYTILAVTSATALTLESTGPSTSGTYTIRKASAQGNLKKLPVNVAYATGQDENGTGTYPLYYDIFEDKLRFYPLFSEDIYVEFRYYKYLPRPTTFATHNDDVTDEAADFLVYAAAAELCVAQDETKYQLFAGKAAQELQGLKKKHRQRYEAVLNEPVYRSTPARNTRIVYDN